MSLLAVIMDILYWLTPWEESAVVAVAAGLAAILFWRGSEVCTLTRRQKIFFWTGLCSLYLALHTQLDYYAEHQFFIHRLQHLALHHLGPMLIVSSSPTMVLLAGMPQWGRQLCHRIKQWKIFRYGAHALCNPVVAVLLFSGLISLWLLPSVHFTAMIDWRVYRLMNWSMFINGLIFWGLVLHRQGWLSMRLSPGTRIGMMLAVVPPQVVLGALIFFTAQELYPIYTICGRAIGGLGAMADQQIGGIILWIHGAMMSAVGILIVVRRELMLENVRETWR